MRGAHWSASLTGEFQDNDRLVSKEVADAQG